MGHPGSRPLYRDPTPEEALIIANTRIRDLEKQVQRLKEYIRDIHEAARLDVDSVRKVMLSYKYVR